MAAPSFIQENATTRDTTTTPKDTASFNVNTGDLLTLWFESEALASSGSTPVKQAGTATVDTVTLRQDPNPGGNQARLTAWTCNVTAGGTLTIRFARGAGSGRWGGRVRTWRTHGGLGTHNSANGSASSASTVTLTGVQADSAIDFCQADWNAGATTGKTYRTADAGTVTELVASAGTGSTIYGGYYANAGAAASKAIGMTAPNQIWTLVGVEVLGTAVEAPILVMAPPRR